ncbi:Hypothetical protein SSCIU_02342 [Mammaliicoccus sciuri]|nr:Hypothetical protein SSCIU_02342 [Mammaliicoccus sciuri]
MPMEIMYHLLYYIS